MLFSSDLGLDCDPRLWTTSEDVPKGSQQRRGAQFPSKVTICHSKNLISWRLILNIISFLILMFSVLPLLSSYLFIYVYIGVGISGDSSMLYHGHEFLCIYMFLSICFARDIFLFFLGVSFGRYFDRCMSMMLTGRRCWRIDCRNWLYLLRAVPLYLYWSPGSHMIRACQFSLWENKIHLCWELFSP